MLPRFRPPPASGCCERPRKNAYVTAMTASASTLAAAQGRSCPSSPRRHRRTRRITSPRTSSPPAAFTSREFPSGSTEILTSSIVCFANSGTASSRAVIEPFVFVVVASA
jgi:hypothetical protein